MLSIQQTYSGNLMVTGGWAMQGKKVQLAAVRAINRAITSGRALWARAIAEDTGLKVGDVKDAIDVKKASLESPKGVLGVSLRRIPLIDFGARETRAGVRYKFGKDTRTLEHAFIATMGSGHEGVFMRAGGKRLPIRELKGPSLGHVGAKHQGDALAQMAESFKTNFAHEFEYLQQQADASGGAE